MSQSPRRRRLTRDQRRALVLQAALTVFAAEGYHHASMDEIALGAGISKPVLYDHFDSKRALYVAVLEQQVQALSARVLPHANPTNGTLEERVRLSALTTLRFARENPQAWRLLFQEPTGDREIAKAFSLMRATVARSIAAGIDEQGVEPPGKIEHELATSVVASLLMAAIERLGNLALERPSVDPEVLVGIYMGLVWTGIRRLSELE